MIIISGISTYASHKILDFILGRQSFTAPEKFYLGVSTTPLGSNGVGATEPSDPAYQRLVIDNNKSNFSTAVNRMVSFINERIFPVSTQNWGKCTHFLFYDNLGNIWFYGELQVSRDVEIDSCLIIEPYTNQFCVNVCNDADNDNVCDGSTSNIAITTYAANKLADHIFGRSPTLILPEKYYLGLSSTPLSPDGIGAIEPFGGGYKRLELPNDKNTFTVASNKSITFAKEFRFPNAEIPWGNMKYYFISETPMGENVWWTGKLKYDRNVEVATTLSVKPNDFVWKLDNCNHSSESVINAVMSSLMNTTQYWG